MAILAVADVVDTGLDVAAAAVAAAAGGDEFANRGDVVLYVDNAGGSPCVVTIDSKIDCDQGADHDAGGSVPAGEFRFFGPFNANRFNPAGARVDVTYDQVTSVTVAAIKIPRGS